MAGTKNNNGKKSSNSKPSIMDQLLDKSSSGTVGLTKGQTVTATLLDLDNNSAIFDIGAKGEGVVTGKAYDEVRSFVKGLKVGDTVSAKVLIPETPEGTVILSLRDAAHEAAWKKIEEAKKNSKIVVVYGKAQTPAGLIVEVYEMEGFIPTSQISKEYQGKSAKSLVGTHFQAKVVEANKKESKLVLSERAVSEAEDIEDQRKALENIKTGDVYEGRVVTLAGFGAFVAIKPDPKSKTEVEGLVHLSELSWEKVSDPNKVVKEGDKVKVKVLDKGDSKLALSIKQAQKDPWDDVANKYKKGKSIKGKITRRADFGVFVQLEPGVEGLIHLTKIPPGSNLKKGDIVSCTIEEVSQKDKRISLDLALSAKPVGYK